MTIEIIGDIVLTFEYWDCECEENYIHARSEKKCCTCGVFRSDQPLARINEVVAIGLSLKSKNSLHKSFFVSQNRSSDQGTKTKEHATHPFNRHST